MLLLGSALMAFAGLIWLRGSRHLSCGSQLTELTLACALLNVAAFDTWLLGLGARQAVTLWAAHALAAGVVTGIDAWTRGRARDATLRRVTLAQTGAYALLAGIAAVAVHG